MFHTLENARKKAQNDANFLNESGCIFVYNNEATGMEGHHLCVSADMKEHYLGQKDLNFVEDIEPNGEPVKFA